MTPPLIQNSQMNDTTFNPKLIFNSKP